MTDSCAPDRFFFALRPPVQLARRVAVFAARLAGDSYRITAKRLHLTVAITRDFPDYPAAFVQTLLDVGGRIAAAPVPVRLERLVHGNRSVMLLAAKDQPELRALYLSIAARMASARAPLRAGTGFNPHMTLFYQPGATPERRVKAFEWQADELLLIRSLVGLRRHDVLGRWPLRAAEPSQYALF